MNKAARPSQQLWQDDFAIAVFEGLSRTPKSIPCRYFYDARGSELFEQITDLPEYYPTRAEIALLEAHAPEMADLAGPGRCLIEFGSGSSRKTDILLRALPALSAYVPVDISATALADAAQRLARQFPELRVWPLHGDFNGALNINLPSALSGAKRLGFFPGSTIGNFTQGEAVTFLRRARTLLGKNSAFIVGADLEKDRNVLLRAYDDSAGVTAAFNLNLLRRINRDLDADFDIAGFAHLALYNEDAGCIEMHLQSLHPQTVNVAGARFHFQAGETIHTENSHKYTVAGFQAMAQAAGWDVRQVWTGPERLFSVHYLVPSGL